MVNESRQVRIIVGAGGIYNEDFSGTAGMASVGMGLTLYPPGKHWRISYLLSTHFSDQRKMSLPKKCKLNSHDHVSGSTLSTELRKHIQSKEQPVSSEQVWVSLPHVWRSLWKALLLKEQLDSSAAQGVCVVRLGSRESTKDSFF